MGRPATKTRLRDARLAFAVLLKAALVKGQRGDGEIAEEHWLPWTQLGFANAVHAHESAVRKWVDADDPSPPHNIMPILKTLFGDLPRYQDRRKAMHAAWHAAGGIDPMVPPDARAIKTETFSDVAEVVYLLLNQPTPDNQGNLIVPYTLRLFHDRNRKVPVVLKGKKEVVEIDIGLTEPVFAVRSTHWQPKQDTVFRGRRHKNTDFLAVPDAVVLTGGKDGAVVVGEPLADEPHVLMEKTGPAGDGAIVFSVLAKREGFHVAPSGGGEVSRTRKAVLDAIFASDIPRDNSDRLIVARAQVTPGASPKDEA